MKKILLFLLSVICVVAIFALVGRIGASNGDRMPGSMRIQNPAASRRDMLIVSTNPYEARFNPLYAETPADLAITRLLFDPLVEPAPDGTPIPVLASFALSVDGKTYTFTLEKATYSDGTPVTAQDVAFTWHVLCDPAYTGPHDIKTLGISGSEAFTEGVAEAIAGVEVVNDSTIRVTLREASATALFKLGIAPLSKAYYGAGYSHGRLDELLLQLSRPMGAGQYSLSELSMQQVTLSRVSTYARGTPSIRSVRFVVATQEEAVQMMVSGAADLDLTGSHSLLDVQAHQHLACEEVLSNTVGLLGFNANAKGLRDPIVRQAIRLCVDREALIERVFGSEGAVAHALPVSALSWAATEMPVRYSTHEASALLEQNGYKKNSAGIYEKDGVALRFTFTVTENNRASAALAEILSEALAHAGMVVSVNTLDYATLLLALRLGQCEMWFMGWQLGADPDLTSQIGTGEGFNLFGYSSQRADELLSSALAETSMERRATMYALLWREMEANPPYVPLYQRTEKIVFNRRLQAFELNPYVPQTACFYQVRW